MEVDKITMTTIYQIFHEGNPVSEKRTLVEVKEYKRWNSIGLYWQPFNRDANIYVRHVRPHYDDVWYWLDKNRSCWIIIPTDAIEEGFHILDGVPK